jgi:hypothetical protein
MTEVHITVHGAEPYLADLLRECAERLTRSAVQARTTTEQTELADVARRCLDAASAIGRAART